MLSASPALISSGTTATFLVGTKHSPCLPHHQVWNAQDAEDECLAMAVRTGLNTGLGNMVRELICPSGLPAPKNPLIQVRHAFLLACLQAAVHHLPAPPLCGWAPKMNNSDTTAFLNLLHTTPPPPQSSEASTTRRLTVEVHGSNSVLRRAVTPS